jgi:hypothetical protein
VRALLREAFADESTRSAAAPRLESKVVPRSAFLFRAGATAGLTGGAMLAIACQVPGLDLEGMRCPCLDGFACVEGSCRPAGAAVSSTSSASGGGSASSSGGGAGGDVSMVPSSDGCSGPLQVVGAIGSGGVVEVKVAGCWSVTFTEASAWQPTRWHDLASDPGLNLASESAGNNSDSNLLFAPAYLSAGPWLSPDDVPASAVTATLEDGAPAYAIVQTHLRWEDAPDANLPGIESTTLYTVWASGRIAAHTELVNTGQATLTVPDVYYSELDVAGPAQEWSGSGLPEAAFDARAAALLRTVGPSPRPSVLVVDRSADDSSLVGLPDEQLPLGWAWRLLGLELAPGGPAHTWDAELQLGPGGQDMPALAARAADALSPGSPLGDGAAGFDAASAAYRLIARGSTIDFAPAPSFTRHRPAFVIDGWAHPGWRIRRAGELLATSSTPASPRAAAHHDAAAARLSFVYLDVIAAADAGEPFVLEAE